MKIQLEVIADIKNRKLSSLQAIDLIMQPFENITKFNWSEVKEV